MRLWLGKNVSLQTSLKRNPSNVFYIFLLNVNFKNLIIGLYILIIFFILTKFQEDKKINSYVINDMFKFQVFTVKNYAQK